ncbi:His Kinase A (phospho-acceptor) domain-containing protein [Stigmatella aurantiaca]|uniref:histidine kinase n=1 Tax=Stigmatella aurantiaca TaxID=41 RepID=A0A1H7FR28_STIAU|nr:ATP-binding protein [Stigmatella aurantiaca]SEK28254.1 His Kinase A (phospho-acceptor) domain-containing protein [Stigmatella aurantiaca]
MDDLQKTKEELLAEVLVLRKALEKSHADLDQFVYVASHDLKAPLRGISNLSQWLEEDLGPQLGAEPRRQLELLRGRVQRMESMIDGLLDYSRAGRVRHKPERVEVSRLVHEVMEQLPAWASARLELGPGMPALTTERMALQQVFRNLLSNALRHARREELVVRVEAGDAQDFHHFRVADNGPGIAPQYHEKIWGLFQTLVARDKVEGSGMGLCVVKRLVESRGGRVWVESAEGAGATFHFTWPKPQERLT